MRIAIARTGNEVAQHFGYCDNFMVYDVENENIVNKTVLKNPGHQPGFLPKFLKENNVNVIISGGMGSKAKTLFDESGIEAIMGTNGTVDQVIKSYLEKTLVGSNETCNHEDHDHN